MSVDPSFSEIVRKNFGMAGRDIVSWSPPGVIRPDLVGNAATVDDLLTWLGDQVGSFEIRVVSFRNGPNRYRVTASGRSRERETLLGALRAIAQISLKETA